MSATHQPSMHVIAAVCATAFDMPIERIMSRRRDAETSIARHTAMWLCRGQSQHTLPEIARYFRRGDHTTIMNAIARVEARLDADGAFGQQVEGIIGLLSTAGPVKAPPLPHFALDMERRRVRLRRRTAAGMVILPAGTLGIITAAKNWARMRFLSDPCACCGVQVFVPVVGRDDLELVA